MYIPGQIIFDLEKQIPVKLTNNVWDHEAYPRRNTHFIRAMGDGTYKISTPETVEEAKQLLQQRRIVPAPIPLSHCWDCHQWDDGRLHFKWCQAVPENQRGNYE